MKKILLSLCAIVIAYSASAQRIGFGPKVGLNVAMITDKAFDPRLNFNAGAFIEYDISAPWSIELSALYSRQGAKMNNLPISLTENRDATFRLDYINMPLVAKFYPWMGLNVFLGPQFSYLVNAELKVKDMDAQSIKCAYKKFDIAAVVGVGYTWENGILVAAQYNCGLNPIYKDKSLSKVYNGVLQLNVGFRF